MTQPERVRHGLGEPRALGQVKPVPRGCQHTRLAAANLR